MESLQKPISALGRRRPNIAPLKLATTFARAITDYAQSGGHASYLGKLNQDFIVKRAIPNGRQPY